MKLGSTCRWAAAAIVAIPLAAGCAEPANDVGAAEPKALELAGRQETKDGTVVVTYSNGLVVIVKATRSAPVVCVRGYVRAGSLFEGRWVGCGLSHLAEHLVAKEAVHDSPDGAVEKHARTLEIGGQSNAYTSQDHTCYHISAAADKAMDCVDLIADQVARIEITPEDFRREHGVVQRELEMGLANPGRLMWYAHAANAFGGHPASVPIIGYAEPLAKLTLDDVWAYVRQMYVPQNTVFAVVGDVDVQAVLERIAGKFAGTARSRQPALDLPEVAPVVATRWVVRPNKVIKDVMARMSFQTIPLVHEDLYALDVLSFILSEGPASRLVRALQLDKRLVTTVGSSSWTPEWGKGLFTVAYRCEPDKLKAAEEAVLAELRAVAARGATQEELARAKRQKLAELVYSRQTAESVAGTLAGDYLSTGDVAFSSHYVARIQRVTATEVQAAARKYFQFDRIIGTRLVPEKMFSTMTAEAAGKAEDRVQALALSNGLRVVLGPCAGTGLASMTFVSKGGLLLEDASTSGLGMLTASLSTRGAGKWTGDEVAAFFDEAGGSLAGQCGNNTTYWTATVLKDRFDAALEIFADVIQRPTFPEKDLETYKGLQAAAIDRAEDTWSSELMKFFRETFFAGTPYGMLTTGSKDVVKAATREKLQQWHRRTLRAGSCVLAVYGEFDAAAARKRIEGLFAGLPAGEAELALAGRRKVAADELHVKQSKQSGQAGIIVAAPSFAITELQDRFGLTVLDTIISGFRLPSGWLHTELRGKRLVYVVHAYNWAGLAPGAFLTYAGTQPEKVPEVIRIIRANLKKAAAYTPTQKEIDRAVNIILTAELLENQSMSDLSMGSALDELYGFGHDFRQKLASYYRKVTPQEVARVGRKYLAGPMVTVVTTPKPDLVKQGP